MGRKGVTFSFFILPPSFLQELIKKQGPGKHSLAGRVREATAMSRTCGAGGTGDRWGVAGGMACGSPVGRCLGVGGLRFDIAKRRRSKKK